MPKGDVETYHREGRWLNRVEGAEQLPGEHDSKEAAVASGRDEARSRGVEHIIRNRDGTIGERNSYGHDPRERHG